MKYDEQDDDKPKSKAKVGPRPNEGDMTKEELQATVHEVLSSCATFIDETLSPERAKATDYYLGKPFGNEKEGRSQVVNTEVRDHVNGVIPSVLRVFFGPEEVVEFTPDKPGAEPTAAAMTKSVRYVFTADNPGFMQTISVLKDGMVRKLGIFKYWWQEGEVTAHVEDDVTRDYIANMLMNDPTLTETKIVPQKDDDDCYEFHYTKKHAGRVVIATLPPEEFLYNPEARDDATALVLGHRTHKRRGDLVDMGIPEKVIDEYGDIERSLQNNAEEVARRGDFSADDPPAGDANDNILYVEAYMRLDVDGNGLVLRKVCTIGPNFHIVHNEPAEFPPFALFCPDPEPHTLTGQSWADRTMDLQLVTSSLIRAMLDSLSLSIFPRTAYVEGQVNPRDVLNTEIGAPIRERAPNMVREFTHTFVGRDALPVLGFFGEIGERRTGQSNGTNDLDMDALQSTTKSAADAAIGASQQHVELLARLFAEQTLKPLFRGVARLLKKHQKETRLIRVRDQWVEMSPAQWSDLDVTVRVALGSMLVDKKLAILGEIATRIENVLQNLGPTNPLCGLPELRNVYARAVELSGFPDASEFFKVVPKDWQPQPAPQQPSPEMVVAQIEQQKVELERTKAAATQSTKERELAMREQEIALRHQLEMQKLATEAELKRYELELKYNADITTAELNAGVKREVAATNAALNERQNAHRRTLDTHAAVLDEVGQEHDHIMRETEVAHDKEMRERELAVKAAKPAGGVK